MGYLKRFHYCGFLLLFAVIHSVLCSDENSGTKFIIIYVYRITANVSCGLEAHITTEHVDGAVLDFRTPRLLEEEGGFRASIQIQQHESVVLCASRNTERLPQLPTTGKSNHVRILEASNKISVLMVTLSEDREVGMHSLYPIDIAETVYFFIGFRNSALLLVATETNTHVDISDCVHAHDYLRQYLTHTKEVCSFHMMIDLERYETLFVQENAADVKIPAGALIMGTKPLIAVSESTRTYVTIDGTDKIAYGYSANQLLPTTIWGSRFLIPKPRNPNVKAMAVAIVFDRVVPFGQRNYIMELPGSFRPTRYYLYNKKKNEKIHQLDFLSKWLIVKTDVLVAIVFLVYTTRGNMTALAATNIPPISRYLQQYTWSINEIKRSELACLHVFGFKGDLTNLRLRLPNNRHTRLMRINEGKGYESARMSLNATGTYTLTYPQEGDFDRPGFGAFLEIYDTEHHTTMMTELGMRVMTTQDDCLNKLAKPGSVFAECKNKTREKLPRAPDKEQPLMNILDEDSWECAGGPQWRVSNRGCKISASKAEAPVCDSSNKTACNESSTLCPGNKWGPRCEKDCSIHCVDQECARLDGECLGGCDIGFYGPRCDIACHKGYGGKNCSSRCKTYCRSRTCDPVTLHCEEQSYSRVLLGMGVACVVIFILSPAMGCACYCLTLGKQPTEAFPGDPKTKLFTTEAFEEEGEGDEDDDDEDDEDESSSSSSSHSSHGSPKNLTPKAGSMDAATTQLRFSKQIQDSSV